MKRERGREREGRGAEKMLMAAMISGTVGRVNETEKRGGTPDCGPLLRRRVSRQGNYGQSECVCAFLCVRVRARARKKP